MHDCKYTFAAPKAWHVGAISGIESMTSIEIVYAFQTYCQSEETPLSTHPSDATWYCESFKYLDARQSVRQVDGPTVGGVSAVIIICLDSFYFGWMCGGYVCDLPSLPPLVPPKDETEYMHYSV